MNKLRHNRLYKRFIVRTKVGKIKFRGVFLALLSSVMFYKQNIFNNSSFFWLSFSFLLLSIVLYKYKDQGSFRLLTTNRHGHRHQLVYFSSLLFFSFSLVFCTYVLFYPNHRIIQEKGKEKAPHHHCVEHEKKRRKKKSS